MNTREDFEMDNNIDFAALIEPVAKRLFPGKYNERASKLGVDLRFGTKGSLSVKPKSGTWYDHQNEVGGGTLDLINHVVGGDHAVAMQWLRDHGMIPLGAVTNRSNKSDRSDRKIIATYDYTDAVGNLVHQTVRYEPRDFRQRRPDGNGGWVSNLDGIRPVLYHLPEVKAAVAAGKTIHIVEGEKDADNLRELGLVATTNAMGAGKWDATYNEFLRGAADVVVIGDNDDPGRKHVQDVRPAVDRGRQVRAHSRSGQALARVSAQGRCQ